MTSKVLIVSLLHKQPKLTIVLAQLSVFEHLQLVTVAFVGDVVQVDIKDQRI